uniref:Uncharacterized protein n=1 Tax=Candidatus Kentrum sp. MB TaxID=2138164 RepID=A0A451B845_9GAMM|nr:MAG: hypothetical protein BECKMB1821G_GA0114241_10056 [Candidatus Kentron sp. MB]VFK27850.1 MAG: hypothetical protein BECKMB1821I_GA0114274_10056 [Candidatus Kentron sp. MB]VFK74441.1 MAG: hypothetical protein BECKMB1821H_GA0114242_10056 [Candidatus Kentron sp. MB]
METSREIARFFTDVVLVTAIFAILLLPVWGLDAMVGFLASQGVDSVIVFALTALEYAILVIDIALLVIFIGRNTTHLVRRHLAFR